MGRPLKIAKATLLTLTSVDGTTEEVTVTENLNTLNVIAGMKFTPATTIGGLTAGTTYWILQVLTANTFSVSTTDLSANVNRTRANLTTAGPVTVMLSVNYTDLYFNVPAGAANTYSVVGGSTAIYGNQVLPVVAISIAGTGTLVTDSGNADVYGGGTDFTTDLVVGTGVQTSTGVDLGFVASIGGQVTEVVTDTEATGSFVVTSGDATNFVADKPIVFDTSIGGLVADTVYFVKTIANTTHFTVATAPGSWAVPVTTDTGTVNATQDVLTLSANAAASYASGIGYVYANDEAGFIVRQKGKQKYLVTGGTTGLTGVCYTANSANAALTPGKMNLLGTYANAATAYLQTLDDHTGQIFGTGNVLPNSSPMFATFNTAYAANTVGAQPYPIVSVRKA